MAIAYDTAGYNNAGTGNSSQVNITATGSNRKAIIFVWGDFTPGDPTVTVGGSSTGVTEITRVTLTGTQKVIAYYYDNPPTSSTQYQVTETGSYPEIHVITYTGCASGAVDSYASKTGDTALDLTTTVVASNCWLVSGARDYSDGDIVASTGTTQRNTGAGIKTGDSNGTVGTGAQTMNWSNNGSGNTGGVIVSIAPVATTAIKTANDLTYASVKTTMGLASASVKNIMGLA